MKSDTFSIESAQIVRLIQAHLTECGFHEACRVLRRESGVSGAGASHSNFISWSKSGQWGEILESLAGIDSKYIKGNKKTLLAEIHEVMILELGHVGEVELAYASLRLVQDLLDDEWQTRKNRVSGHDGATMIPPSREVEQKLAALAAGNKPGIPADYYGVGVTQQDRRSQVGALLADCIPLVPHSRLTTLLQQSIKWQAHTGQIPYVKQLWEHEEEEGATEKRKRKRKEFDLVLGQISAPTTLVGESVTTEAEVHANAESIPSAVYSTLKFGKNATVESAVFLPDGSLATGSSDGLVEIWDPAQRYSKLRMDLEYQEREELLYHDNTPILALDVSNDASLLATGDSKGCIKIWRVDTTGQCLREFSRAHEKAISSLAFSSDGSRVLSASQDFTCREYGLRTSRLLKEFRGHTSYVNSCQYVLMSDPNGEEHTDTRLTVVTGSADGTVRIWDGKSSEVLDVFQPSKSSIAGASILISVDQTGGAVSGDSVESIHTVLSLHTPANSLLVVPRGPKAFLVTLTGSVLRTYEDEGTDDYVTATVSPSNAWLYAVTMKGTCHVYDMATGKLKSTLRDFAEQSMGKSSSTEIEISSLIHHPHKGIIGGFSNDKSQKRGLFTLWR